MAKGGWPLALALLLVTWGGVLTGAEATARTRLRAALLRHVAPRAKGHEPQMAEAMEALENAAEHRGVRSSFARARKRATKKARASWAWRMNTARAQAQELEDAAAPDKMRAERSV